MNRQQAQYRAGVVEEAILLLQEAEAQLIAIDAPGGTGAIHEAIRDLGTARARYMREARDPATFESDTSLVDVMSADEEAVEAALDREIARRTRRQEFRGGGAPLAVPVL